MSDYILLISGILLMILGIIGCLVPVLPGPPFSFLGINFSSSLKLWSVLRIHSYNPWCNCSCCYNSRLYCTCLGNKKIWRFQIWNKRSNSRFDYWSVPWSCWELLSDPLIGAFVGEMIFKDDINYALKAGFGSLLGFLTGIGLKLAASFIMTFLLCEGVDMPE